MVILLLLCVIQNRLPCFLSKKTGNIISRFLSSLSSTTEAGTGKSAFLECAQFLEEDQGGRNILPLDPATPCKDLYLSSEQRDQKRDGFQIRTCSTSYEREACLILKKCNERLLEITHPIGLLFLASMLWKVVAASSFAHASPDTLPERRVEHRFHYAAYHNKRMPCKRRNRYQTTSEREHQSSFGVCNLKMLRPKVRLWLLSHSTRT